MIGNGGAEYGVRGYVTAYDAATGDQGWRFYTVPGDPAKGFETKELEMAAKSGRKRVACFEILKGTTNIASMIRDEKTYQLYSAMQVGRSLGNQTFDEALKDLVRRDLIVPETAYMAALKKEDQAALVTFSGWTAGGLFDEVGIDQALEGSVESGRPDAHRSIRPLQDLLHDAVAVLFRADQRQQNMEPVLVKREEIGWILLSHCSSIYVGIYRSLSSPHCPFAFGLEHSP